MVENDPYDHNVNNLGQFTLPIHIVWLESFCYPEECEVNALTNVRSAIRGTDNNAFYTIRQFGPLTDT